jgi:hypothetical protein
VGHCGEVAEPRPQGSPQFRHREEQSIGSRPTAQHPPEALNKIELRTVTGQAIQVEVRLGREHFRNRGGLMPGRIINSEDHGLVQRGRIRPREVASMPGKGTLQSDRFRQPCTPLGLSGTLDEAGRQLPGPHVHRRKTIDQVFVVPGPHYRALACDA